MRPISYSVAEDAVIMDDYNAGRPMNDTARRLGRSLSAVLNRLQRLRDKGYDLPIRRGVPRQDDMARQTAEVMRLRGQGLTVPNIALRLKRTESWVAGRVARARRLAEKAAEDAVEAERRTPKPAKRRCNLCPTVFQPVSPYERFCETCRRSAVHAASWSFSL